MCKGKVGLLAKIVEVLKKEPTDSTFCFWFCRVIDSYLRGTTSFCDQVFLLRRGVLQVYKFYYHYCVEVYYRCISFSVITV